VQNAGLAAEPLVISIQKTNKLTKTFSFEGRKGGRGLGLDPEICANPKRSVNTVEGW